MKSIIEQRGSVAFPEFKPERVYMREFTKAKGLPFDLAKWQPTVDAMLDGIDTSGPIFIMIDCGQIKAGMAQRRPGLHIDGYWIPAIQMHRDTGRHGSSVPDPSPSDPHGGTHSNKSQHASGRHNHKIPFWDPCATYEEQEGLLLASSLQSARGFHGDFVGAPGEGGVCTHVDVSALIEVPMKADLVYAGNVTMLHESLAVETDCFRSLVRLNVPGWSPE